MTVKELSQSVSCIYDDESIGYHGMVSHSSSNPELVYDTQTYMDMKQTYKLGDIECEIDAHHRCCHVCWNLCILYFLSFEPETVRVNDQYLKRL